MQRDRTVGEPQLRRAAHGSGEPVRVLMLHGLGGSASVWDKFADGADASLELWDVELPWSSMAARRWGYRDDPRHVVAEVTRCPGKPRFDAIVAHSFAANLVAETIAADSPAVVLVSPFYRRTPTEFDWPTISYYLNDFHLMYSEGLRVAGADRLPTSLRDDMAIRIRDQIGPYGWMRFFETFLRSPFLDMDALRMPLMIVGGEDDIAAKVADVRALARALPHAELMIEAGCGHFPMIERAATFIPAVCDFIVGAIRGQRDKTDDQCLELT